MIYILIDLMVIIGLICEVFVEEFGYKLLFLLLLIWDFELGVGLIVMLRFLILGFDVGLVCFFFEEVVIVEFGFCVDNLLGIGKICI